MSLDIDDRSRCDLLVEPLTDRLCGVFRVDIEKALSFRGVRITIEKWVFLQLR